MKADHIPIKTIIKANIQIVQLKLRQNYSKTNWQKFEQKIKYQLQKTPPPAEITGKQELTVYPETLTNAILETVEEHVPLMKLYPNRKRWWTSELSTVRKRINKLNRNAHRKRCHPQYPIHEHLKQQRSK